MPYKDRKKHNEVTAERARTRRNNWLATQVCSICGGTADLSIFGMHGPMDKTTWTASTERREVALQNAVVKCLGCIGSVRSEIARIVKTSKPPKPARLILDETVDAPVPVRKGRQPKPIIERDNVLLHMNDAGRRARRRAFRDERREALGYGDPSFDDDGQVLRPRVEHPIGRY